jgi:hypothetical protein
MLPIPPLQPLIRGDIRFAGWEPIDEAEYSARRLLERVQQDRTGPETVVVSEAAAQTEPVIGSRIVKARPPNRRR